MFFNKPKPQLGMMLTGGAITLMVPGRKAPFAMNSDHQLFDELVKAATSKNIDEVLRLIDVAETIKTYTSGKVSVRDGEVFIGNEAVHNTVTDRILAFIGQGLPFDPLARFLERLMNNPSSVSREELYLFLENGQCPIMEDGRFVAYKWVNDDYTDCHTGTFDNSVGQVLEMPRAKVDDDRRQTCSAGFHVCTHAYTKFGTRLMLVAIDPADVVSVPYDYNNAKMRVCKYEVIEEVPAEDYQKFDQQMYQASQVEENEIDEEEEDEGCHHCGCGCC